MNKNGIRYPLTNVSKYLFCYILEEVIYIYFKSPLNYTGGKYKLLPQLLPLLLSNVIEHKGKTNYILKDWSRNYKVHYIEKHYKDTNYQVHKKDTNITKEVLVTNY